MSILSGVCTTKYATIFNHFKNSSVCMRKKVCVWTLERAKDQGWADLEICTIKMGVYIMLIYPLNYLSAKALIMGGNRYIFAY
jgi:hypothetical protein